MNGAFGHKIYNGTSLTYMNMNIFPDYNVMKKAPGRNIKDQTATDYWLEKETTSILITLLSDGMFR